MTVLQLLQPMEDMPDTISPASQDTPASAGLSAGRPAVAPVCEPGDRPKILLLIDGMAALTDGGTERQLLQLAGVARRAGLEPTIAVLRDTEWLTPQVAGCRVAALRFRSLSSPASLLELLRLLRWMRRERFAILQTFFTDANLLGPLLGRWAGIPAILGTRRSLTPAGERLGPAARLLAGPSQRAATRILTNAEAVSRNIAATEGVPAAKLTVIYNGIALEALRPLPRGLGAKVRNSLHVGSGQLLVGNISGLRAVKRLELFLEAAAIARAAAPELRFVIVGEGERRHALEQQIGALNLQGIVTLAGAQEDVRPWLAAMDVGVLCSEAEGFSNSLLEYMAAGLPIVATEVGGNREALGEAPGEAGLLVPSGDSQSLAAAMLRLLDPGVRKAYGARAAARVERFSLETAEERMAALYREHCPALATGAGKRRSRAYSRNGS